MARVLVVDDSDVIGTLLQRNLEDAGYAVEQVSDHARDLLNPSSEAWAGADVLICDLRMPTVSGLELLSVARTFFPNIRRVAFTGLSELDQETIAAGAVADVVLHKPEDVLRIADVVRGLL